MSRKSIPKRIPFSGGINTVAERATLNGFSVKNNYRDLIPYGFEQRAGQARQHTTTESTQEITQLFQYIDRGGTKHFYAQRVDGSVHEATNNPPAITTGDFGSEVLGARSNTIPASVSIMDNYLTYSDGARQHQIHVGAGQRVSAFIVYKSTGVIPVIPQRGEDYTDEVSDAVTTRVANLNSLNTLANYHAIYVCTEVPANALTFTMVNTNSNAATLSGQYWNGAWTALSGLSDGTALAGATFGQSGTVSWTHPTDEIDYFQFGRSGFWYRFNVSAILDSTVSVSQVTYSGNWQTLRNVWSGELEVAGEAQVYRVNNLKYERWAGNQVPLGGLFATSGDWVYFVSLYKLFGIYANMGATPNITRAIAVGSSDISFVDGGINDDYITWQQARFLEEGFEAGMTIVITGTTSNNITVKAKAVHSDKIYVNTGLLTTENNKSATLTFTNTGATLDMEVWTGEGYENVSNLNDATSGLALSGYITFSRTTTAQKSMQNGSFVYGYWYRFALNKIVSRNCQMGINLMSFHDIADLGSYGYANCAWGAESRRNVIAFDKDPVVLISATNRPMVFNGSEYHPMIVGDGRNNKVLAMANLFADLLVFQEELGEKGGCITMIQGFDRPTFGKMPISNKEGIINGKALCTIHGFETPNNPKAATTPVVFFISRYGVYFCDGAGITNISYDIANYFDPSDANCIRRGYENKHWLVYDQTYRCIRVGLCTGSSATVANTFLVFNPNNRTWGTDTLGQVLTCASEIEAASGDKTVLQYGGSSDGFIYRLNTGVDDVGASTVSVDSYTILEIDGEGAKIDLKEMQARCKAQTGNIIQSMAYNGNTSYIDSNTLSMAAVTAGDSYRYNDIPVNRGLHDHLSLKLEHNTVGEGCTLLDVTLLDAEVKNVHQS